jgi:phytoene dehydrogenase-like protein
MIGLSKIDLLFASCIFDLAGTLAPYQKLVAGTSSPHAQIIFQQVKKMNVSNYYYYSTLNKLLLYYFAIVVVPFIAQAWILHHSRTFSATSSTIVRIQKYNKVFAAVTKNGKVEEEDGVRIIDNNNNNNNDDAINKRSSPRIVIIGAGVGGLATAARIASQIPAAKITVLEKNGRDKVGGRCGSFTVDIDGVGSFRHERGPSLLLLKEEYETLFAECCPTTTTSATAATSAATASAAQAYGLTIKQCIPAYQVIFDDGDTISLGFPRSKCTSTTTSSSSSSSSAATSLSVHEIKQIQILEEQSIAKFNSMETNGFLKWTDYLNTCSAYLDCGLPNFIENKLHLPSFPSFLYESLRDYGKRWPLQPHSSMLANIFTSPKLMALASFQDLYVGLEPYSASKQFFGGGGGIWRNTAPAVFGLLAAIELHPTNKRAGVFAPMGGFAQVANSMYQLCLNLNVTFQFHTSVTKIDEEGGGVHFLVKNVETE